MTILRFLLLLNSSIFLTACETLPLHEVSGFALDELKITRTNNKVYLKPYDDSGYGVPLGENDRKKEALEAAVSQKFRHFRLLNGLEVFILPRPNVPTISISAIIAAGKNYVSNTDELQSPLVLKLLKQGTERYPKAQFQQLATQLGATMDYRQTPEFSVISVDILPQDLNLALTLFAQQLMHIKPDKHALEKVIEQHLLEKKLVQSSGGYWAKQWFYQTNYPMAHPYFYKVPTSKKIKKIDLEQLLAFYNKYYVPEQTRIILAGDVDVKETKVFIENRFGSWQSTGMLSSNNVYNELDDVPEHQSRVDIINRNAAQQANILYGAVTVPGSSQEKPALDIIAALLGGGPNSRLFADLREQQGLTYSVYAYQIAGRYRSPFFIQTSVAHNKVSRTILAIREHIDYLCQNPVDVRELEQVKQQLTGERLFQFQTNRQWVNEKIKHLESGYDDMDMSQYGQRIRAVSTIEVNTIMKRYLCQQHQFIVVGDKSKIIANFRKNND